MSNNGAIGGNRTHDLRLTKAPLYPLATMALLRDGEGLKKSLSQTFAFLECITHNLLHPSLMGGKWFIEKHGKLHN